MALTETLCAGSCTIPKFSMDAKCRTTKNGPIIRAWLTCNSWTTSLQGANSAAHLTYFQNHVNNTTDTSTDTEVIREMNGVGSKPAAGKVVAEAEGCYDEQTTDRQHTMVFKVLDHNKVNYNAMLDFQRNNTTVYLAYMTKSCDVFIVEQEATISDVSLVINETNTPYEWTITFSWTNITDPQCISYALQACQFVNDADQATLDSDVLDWT